jgi:hypothetical protein
MATVTLGVTQPQPGDKFVHPQLGVLRAITTRRTCEHCVGKHGTYDGENMPGHNTVHCGGLPRCTHVSWIPDTPEAMAEYVLALLGETP